MTAFNFKAVKHGAPVKTIVGKIPVVIFTFEAPGFYPLVGKLKGAEDVTDKVYSWSVNGKVKNSDHFYNLMIDFDGIPPVYKNLYWKHTGGWKLGGGEYATKELAKANIFSISGTYLKTIRI